MAVVCDNASNNDTMMASLGERFLANNIRFVVEHGHIRCFPHTAHLAALEVRQCMVFIFHLTHNTATFQLLEGIGALSKEEKKKAEKSNFQETVTAPADRELDNEAAAIDEEADGEAGENTSPDGASILSAISKVGILDILHAAH